MKKIINKIAILLVMAIVFACVDESKDPIKFNEVSKATYLALRGAAFDELNNTNCSNSFFKNNILGTEVFTFESDLLSENQESLQEVQLFAETPKIARVQITTFPGSNWTLPAGETSKRGTISVPLATILSKLGLTTITAASLKQADITMTTDLVLTDGTIVPANSIVAVGLYASVIFQPAMTLTYCANDKADFVPAATTKLLGAWSINDDKKVVHSELPLRSGAKDTLYIKFDQDIITPPTITFNPPTAGTQGSLVKAKKVDKNGFYTKDEDPSAFYMIYTAGSSFTGVVTATVTGATAKVAGAILTQDDKEQAINVDNTNPVIVSAKTGTRIGAGQFVTMKVTLNEKLSAKSTDVIKVTVDGTALGLETVTNAPMTLAPDGLSATLIYIFKLKDPLVAATHGNLTVKFSNAIDEAGNVTSISDGALTVDVNAPPAPTLTATGTYDLGTQIRWSASQSVDNTPVTGNPGGSTSGGVYFIAVAAGDPVPTSFKVDLDGVATWGGADILDEGNLAVDGGGSGTVFTSFGANGTFDVYAVFVSSTGTVSKISSIAPVVAPGSGNPLTITMN